MNPYLGHILDGGAACVRLFERVGVCGDVDEEDVVLVLPWGLRFGGGEDEI